MKQAMRVGENIYLDKSAARLQITDRVHLGTLVVISKTRIGEKTPYEVIRTTNTITDEGREEILRRMMGTASGNTYNQTNAKLGLYTSGSVLAGTLACTAVDRPSTNEIKWTFEDATGTDYGPITEMRMYNEGTASAGSGDVGSVSGIQFNSITGLTGGYSTAKRATETWTIEYTLTMNTASGVYTDTAGAGTDQILALLSGASTTAWPAGTTSQIFQTDSPPTYSVDTVVADSGPTAEWTANSITWTFQHMTGESNGQWFNVRVANGATYLRTDEDNDLFDDTKNSYDVWTISYVFDLD